ncbi:MAG TPA: V-type ATP synthase subunit E [Anaerolineales bacterium]|nr:V-type ATP synthase subunit E [Anaerolineales bacterium]
MSLQAILEKIRASGETQVQEIEKGAQSQVNGILAQARVEARQIEEDACANASAPAIAERARILHRARLESLRIVGDVREDLVDTAITRTRERLAAVRADSSYPSVLRTLTEETLAELASGGKAQLLADPRDRELLKNILGDLKLDLPVSYELNCWGGLIAKSEDGRVVVINTFESRLERATAFLRHCLAALFEEEQTETKQIEVIAHL